MGKRARMARHMDAETLTTITALAGAAKPAFEAIRAALSGAKGREAGKATPEALRLVDDLQARIFQLQEIAFRLHREKAEAIEENAKLREQIRRKEEGAADRERYETRYLCQSPVKVAKEEPNAFLCATCFEADQKVYLSKVPADMSDIATHYCPKCNGIVGAP